MPYQNTPVQTFLYLYPGSSVAGLLQTGIELPGATMVSHCVVFGHPAQLLDTQHATQSQFRHQPVLEGAIGPLHPSFGLGAVGQYLGHAQFFQSSTPLSRPAISSPLWTRTPGQKDGVAIGVHCHGHTPTSDDALEQGQVAPGVLLFLEQGIRHLPSSIVHCQQQGQPGSSALQPGMVAAIQLQQHSLLGHPWSTTPVVWRSTLAWARESGPHQEAPYGGQG